MRKRRKWCLVSLLIDGFLVNGAAVLAFLIHFKGDVPPQNFAAYTNLWIFITIIRLSFLALGGFYRQGKEAGWTIDDFFKIVKASTLSSFVIIVVTLFVHLYYAFAFEFSRLVAFYAWLLNIILVSIGHFLIEKFAKREGPSRVLIVGAGKSGEMVSHHLRTYPDLSYEIVGFVDDDRAKQNLDIDKAKVIGVISDIPQLVEDKQIGEVIIALPSASHQRTLDIVSLCEKTGVKSKIVPDRFEIMAGESHLHQLADIPFIELLPEPIQGLKAFVKRSMDILISSLVLLLFLPVMIIVAIFVKLDSRGAVFFKQERVGKDGKIFKIYKFRSMIEDAEKHTGPVWAEEDDSRMTRIGKVLRRTSLDELPQFFNILKGEMSLVGPRPERPFFVKQHQELNGWRISIRPGITGLAQINGRYNLSIKEKAKYDLYYIRNQSFSLDLKILIETIEVVFHQQGVY